MCVVTEVVTRTGALPFLEMWGDKSPLCMEEHSPRLVVDSFEEVLLSDDLAVELPVLAR
jgi:hypothetical protein